MSLKKDKPVEPPTFADVLGLLDDMKPKKALKLLDAMPAPLDSDFLYLRARALAQSGRFDEAWPAYDVALAAVPGNSTPLRKTADLLCSLSLDLHAAGREAECLGVAARAAASNPRHSYSWVCTGYFFHLGGETDVCLVAIALAVALDHWKADDLEADDDFGDLRADARYEKALRTAELSDADRESLAGRFPAGDPIDAARTFLGAIAPLLVEDP